MSRASKDRRAKEKRRRGYESAFVKKALASSRSKLYDAMVKERQATLERDEAKKNEAIARSALKDVLQRQLVIKHLDDAFDIAVLVEHTVNDTFYAPKPKRDRPFAEPGEKTRPSGISYVPGSTVRVTRTINKPLGNKPMAFDHTQSTWLRHVTRGIAEEITNLIVDQLLLDCITAKKSTKEPQ